MRTATGSSLRRAGKGVGDIRGLKQIHGRRIVALLLALCLLAVCCGFGLYAAVNIHHHCTGDDCPVCQVIRILEAMLQDFAGVAVCLLFLVCLSVLALRIVIHGASGYGKLSPVRLFDRMNN